MSCIVEDYVLLSYYYNSGPVLNICNWRPVFLSCNMTPNIVGLFLTQSSTWRVSAGRSGPCPTPDWGCYDWTGTKWPTRSCPPTGCSAFGFSRAFTSDVLSAQHAIKTGLLCVITHVSDYLLRNTAQSRSRQSLHQVLNKGIIARDNYRVTLPIYYYEVISLDFWLSWAFFILLANVGNILLWSSVTCRRD